jgi:hypothetical protein
MELIVLHRRLSSRWVIEFMTRPSSDVLISRCGPAAVRFSADRTRKD